MRAFAELEPLVETGRVEVDVVDQNTETTVTFKLFQPAFMYFHVYLKDSNEKQKIVFHRSSNETIRISIIAS